MRESEYTMIEAIIANLFTVSVLEGILIGVIGGIIIGALPGLGSTMGIALLIPISYGMNPTAALVMLTSLYTAAVFGGSFTAIMLHTPGTAASAATAMDGYELAKRGEGLRAMGISTVSSVTGGTLSGIALLFIAPPLAALSLRFSAPEYFLLAIFGLTIIGSLSADNMLKGLISGALGLAVALIGYDVQFGLPRFTYDVTALESGITAVCALIGLFSLSQVLIQAEEINNNDVPKRIAELKGRFWPTLKEYINLIPFIIRASIVGIIIGILPGAGGDIGGWMGYNEAKRFSKHKELFGHGSIEGICGSETGNNAVTGGALIPLMTLGIPGSSAAAALLGGLMIHGMQPGYDLFTKKAGITYAIIIGFICANLLMGIVGALFAKQVAKVANVKYSILAPIIVVLSVVGSFAIHMSYADVCVMAVFGFLGYLMRKFGFPTAPLVLAIILGPMAEDGLLRSLVMANGTPLLSYYAQRPACLVLLAMIVASVFTPIFMTKLNKKARGEKADSSIDLDKDD